ncbi:PAAR domain-containing protein [Pseudomonas turukhanskensis]|uniref:PAAR domain-containing protein n=1 Tax=Pseudomonas turukhanskensis TaxID=1806536 RepID=A0A9W6NG14_9PSED|nr:PAAR domain-containing protein [Pseudomonas turukhanskensis]GLK89382.1 hypothetical protein GCM10017655_24440 [Pseudomonas turukhanskensis]
MTEGFFVGKGDKTTCGGEVLDGDARVNMFGILHAREGDRVSCGKDGKIYQISGGVPFIDSHGKLMAGTLDSWSTCPCKARLIASVHGASYYKEDLAPQASRTVAQPFSSTAASPPATPQQSAFMPSGVPASAAFTGVEPQEPGFYVVPKSMSRQALEATLFPEPDPAVMRKFNALNLGVGEVKAGSMIVLSDPDNSSCTYQEALLMEAAAKANDALKPLSADEADFMMQHHDEIEAFLAHGATAIGIGETIFAKHLENVRTVLRDIEELHQRSFQRDGHLRSQQFFAQRKRLLSLLDNNLNDLTRKGIGLSDHPNLKHTLGISNKSLVHKWTQAGAAGQIPGYATHIDGVSKAAKVVKYGGWVGTAVGGGASYMKVQDVCSAGSTEECEKVKFTETASFIGGAIGGAAAGFYLTGSAVGTLCLAIGVPTLGAGGLVCGIVVVGVSSFAAGAITEKATEIAAEKIYEVTK